MKVTTISKFGFVCPECKKIHTPDSALETDGAYNVGGEYEVRNGYLFGMPGEELQVYVYSDDDNCVGEEMPEYQTAYQCGECETVYLDKDQAKDCCKS